MRFEETKELVMKRNTNEKIDRIADMLNDFLKSGIAVAEIKDWESEYSRPELCRLGIDYAMRSRCIDGIRTRVSYGHIYIVRLEK